MELTDTGLARAELGSEIDKPLPAEVVPAHDVQVPLGERCAERLTGGPLPIHAADDLLLGAGPRARQALLERVPSIGPADVIEADHGRASA